MFKAIKKKLKDQRGLTLVELLAVVVILGIIAAIAVPSIGNIIEKSKTDAHKSTALQMINAARLAVTNNDSEVISFSDVTENNTTTKKATVKLSALESHGYIDNIVNPSDKSNGYNKETSLVVVTKGADGKLTYKVTLKPTTGSAYVDGKSPEDL
ncbi:type IV pilin protein [Mesobacillus subterraneus]|uniref:Prepilin-type N-terminal cleavage/methylation domain-containing protein n=1 Tax=Mesobacillus subterraneus TaxID=285983 RepID=A0A427TIU5_9BACI|nr:prepilin-type N-terminal cleavage/methylation domain-containing protein [Mesobacillus subterraneus]RSD23316.1 prepilin-type N-terminal cleavage/methylation domain-containing protein [Mesobacillus subterraneus]